MKTSTQVGIDAAGVCIPKSYLQVEQLAELRSIPPQKLLKGLGLRNIALCNEDESVTDLIAQSIIDLFYTSEGENGNASEWFSTVDRIYLGTESAVDGSKPTISYALDIVREKLNVDFERVDVVDLTFACIGGVDALQTCLDYVRLNPKRKCIVVAGDIAKYDLNSGGEYTQGAGAVALLIAANPRMLSIGSNFGVSSVHDLDFYKPIRKFHKRDIAAKLADVLKLDTSQKSNLDQLLFNSNTESKRKAIEGEVESFWDIPSHYVSVLRKEPVYDGHYSNKCFDLRINSALHDFMEKSSITDLENFGAWLFHLPYCYQGRRIAVKYWYEEIVLKSEGASEKLRSEVGELIDSSHDEYKAWLKTLSKSNAYLTFVERTILPSEYMSSRIGNMYTASIFMALLSHIAFSTNKAIEQSRDLLFLAYGSGSKSKVFAGKLNAAFNRESLKEKLTSKLVNRTELSVNEYELQHQNF